PGARRRPRDRVPGVAVRSGPRSGRADAADPSVPGGRDHHGDTVTHPVVVAAAAASAALGVRAASRHGWLPGGERRWERVNHAGSPVTLTEGLGLAAGTVAPLRLTDPAAAWAVTESAMAGALDDLDGRIDVKGLGGHLRLLRDGE